MTDMVVQAFDALDGAHNCRDELVELNNEFLLRLDQAVEVVRNSNGQVKVKEEKSLAGAGALGGAFWRHLSA